MIGLFSSWFVRKFTARIENRIGPPLLQPVYDILKLLSKEVTQPKGGKSMFITLLPRIQLLLAVFLSFLIPITSEKGLLSFQGDAFLFLFLVSIHGITIMFLGYSSNNPYTTTGYGRLAFTELSFELPLIFSFSSLIIATKETSISGILLAIDSLGWTINGILIRILIFALFILMLYSGLGFLEFNPFSAAHAETEIVAGWQTELTGANLAYVYLSDGFNLFSVVGLISLIFLGLPNTPNSIGQYSLLKELYWTGSFLLKFLVTLGLFTVVKTLSSRIRVDQTIKVVWNRFLPTSILILVLMFIIV